MDLHDYQDHSRHEGPRSFHCQLRCLRRPQPHNRQHRLRHGQRRVLEASNRADRRQIGVRRGVCEFREIRQPSRGRYVCHRVHARRHLCGDGFDRVAEERTVVREKSSAGSRLPGICPHVSHGSRSVPRRHAVLRHQHVHESSSDSTTPNIPIARAATAGTSMAFTAPSIWIRTSTARISF